ncbi:large extracellular alpha-helical protein [Candidatus Thiomargarita nelsonii]|uniref:Large extracellular alpha-helical protein n=1 Tax=Candidatus Thiomargarita nelsonii TaxID=1003181 RepID=A0A0A6PMS1_9GAMM|nr:large extracellular alpha-helical protein [Candidatus Thiomargarita nelsonii]
MIKIHLLLLLALLTGWLQPTWAADSGLPLKITRITPSGTDVYAGRQIVITFNQAVVPLGKMEREAADIPITITPALQCEWRWLNTTSLACQLNHNSALKLATRYDMQIMPGIMTENKQTLKAAYHHQFITKRPAVRYTSFQTWRAPGMPKIRVYFNQPVTRDSVAKHLYMQTSQSVPVMVEPRYRDEPSVSSVWLVSPKQLLPLDTQAMLVVKPGIQSDLGPETGNESRTVVTFHTFPEFKFLGVKCTTLDDKSIFILPHSDEKRCNPLRAVSLQFSSPVIREVVKENMFFIPDLAGGRTDYDPWENISSYSQLDQSHSKGETYSIWLPGILKAYHNYRLSVINPYMFKDEFGRSLSAPIDMQFATDHRLPRHVFEHDISVLEKGVDSELPVVVTNLEQISLFYRLLTPQGWTDQKQRVLPVPQVEDIAFKMPLGIRDLMPNGIAQGYFTSKPDVNNKQASKYNWFFTQITPFHIQAKLGHHNTLVWVTDFATGLPVSGVDVSVYLDTYNSVSKALAVGVTDANGIALLPGTKSLDPNLEYNYVYGDYQKDQRFFVHCQKDQDIALLPLDSDFRVSLYDLSDVYPHMRQKYDHIRTWGTTAQGVYKVGDTVQYKFFVRDEGNERLVPAPREGYSLEVTDPMGKVAHEVKNLSLSEFGAFHGEFTLPKNAPVGWYDFELSAKFKKRGRWYPLRVLVSDFTPSPFRVRTELNGELFHLGDKVTVNTAATLHAGGPYVNAQTRINAILSQQDLQPSHPQAKGFWFDVYVDKVGYQTVFSADDKKVDDKGLLQTSFTLSEDSKVLYGKLMVESAVRDDRGKQVANSTTARYVGRDRFVGLKETSWLLTAGQEAKVLLLVVDEHGNPIADTDIDVNIERRITKASRVKGAGNAYLTHYDHQWINAANCQAKSEVSAGSCTFVPANAGIYKITATIKDSKGRSHSTELRQWAVGKGYVMWETAPGHGLEIVPEQENYKVGETARYLVKNPYPGAKALITVERLGTIKSWVQSLENSMEIIEIPVEPDYVPGFFVSVTVMSPRVDKPIDKNQVDLGKPAFRMGYVQTDVKEPYKELVVDIKTDKPVYKPGEQVTIDLQASPRHDGGQPIELAVTVLDESVFDLLAKGRAYFDPYKGFYSLSDLDMANFSMLMRLVGRIKFEKKGANAGGDGGANLSMRSLFKYVSYWNPSIKTDAAGKAQIQFTVPDNLTGWRVLVMAVTPGDLMGLGDANFKVNLPIEIRSALPNQVLSGDHFQAGFTVMNRTDKVRELKIALEAKLVNGTVRHTDTLQAQPYKRYLQWLPVKTTAAGTIQFAATATDGEESDGLRKTLKVLPRRPSTTVATYGTTVANEVTESVLFPTDIHSDVGGLSVIASPTVIGGVDGAFEYMRDYPYACWEQKLSKATMASHYNNLRPYLADSLTWEDSQSLPEKTIALAKEYQAPNGGMAYYIAKNKYVSPYLSAYTALAFNWLRDSGYEIPELVENKLHDYLLTLLRKNVMPDFYSQGMASSVRAVALAALAKHEKISREDLFRYKRHVERMDLFGKSQFLAAALQVRETDRIRNDVIDMILAHADQTPGKVSFTESLDANYKLMLSSSLRTECAVLSSLVKQGNVGDISFKLVRNITQKRKNRGHWENTQENMFCMNALIDYARVYEKDAPLMTVRSWLEMENPVERNFFNRFKRFFSDNQEKLGETRFDDVKNPPVTFSHDMRASDPGKKATVKLEREGKGRLYYTVRLAYSEKGEKATSVNAGIEVKREYHVERAGKWILLKSPMEIKTGELVRVDLYVSLPAPRYFVVVDDPVPGGLEPVNRDLATSSKVDADKAQGQYAGGSLWFRHNDWKEYALSSWNFYHKELRHHAAIFYSDYLPAGNYHLSYVAQAIAPGEFGVMATHAEEMYEPEVFGKGMPAILKVVRD